MKCIKRLLSKLGYYYYYQETQAVKMDIDGKGYYLIVNHFTKNAQLISQEEIDKRQHQDKKGC